MPPSAQGLWWSHVIWTFVFTASSALVTKWQRYIRVQKYFFIYWIYAHDLENWKKGSHLAYYLTDCCGTMLIYISWQYRLLTGNALRMKAYFPKLFKNWGTTASIYQTCRWSNWRKRTGEIVKGIDFKLTVCREMFKMVDASSTGLQPSPDPLVNVAKLMQRYQDWVHIFLAFK